MHNNQPETTILLAHNKQRCLQLRDVGTREDSRIRYHTHDAHIIIQIIDANTEKHAGHKAREQARIEIVKNTKLWLCIS